MLGVLRAAQGIYFTKNETKDLTITLVREKLMQAKEKEPKEDETEVLAEIVEILESYKRLPAVLEEIRRECGCGDK